MNYHVFVSDFITQENRTNIINLILKKFPNVIFDKKFDPKNTFLRIVDQYEFFFIFKSICLTITPLCLKQMIDNSINPFKETNKAFLANIHLYNKKIGFFNLDKKYEDNIIKLVQRMYGSISNDADIYITNSKKIKQNIKKDGKLIVTMDYIHSLFKSNFFIDFLKMKKK